MLRKQAKLGRRQCKVMVDMMPTRTVRRRSPLDCVKREFAVDREEKTEELTKHGASSYDEADENSVLKAGGNMKRDKARMAQKILP